MQERGRMEWKRKEEEKKNTMSCMMRRNGIEGHKERENLQLRRWEELMVERRVRR